MTITEDRLRIDALVKAGAFEEARRELSQLPALESDDPNGEPIAVLNALSWYKDPELNPRVALERAARFLEPFVRTSEDPETLGVAGGVERRLYEIDLSPEHIERALEHYRRGHGFDRGKAFRLRQGYPGINAAYLLDLLARLAEDAHRDDQARIAARRAEAKGLREELVTGLDPLVPETPTKADYFLLVTLAEAYLGLGRFPDARRVLALAAETPDVPGWQYETTGRQLASLLRLQSMLGSVPKDGRDALTALFGTRADALFAALAGKIGLALSGGGFRASFFHLGVLAHLAEIDLLRYVEVLSCVSGGSLVGAAYYLRLQRLYGARLDGEIDANDYVALVRSLSLDFKRAVQRNIRMRVLVDPLDNMAMLSGDRSRTERAGELYEEHLYPPLAGTPQSESPTDRQMMTDLKIQPKGVPASFSPWRDNWGRRAKVPVIVFNAATLNTGHNWQFTAKSMGEPLARADEDVDTNDRFERADYAAFPEALHRVPLGRAVGASACVPGIFEPIELHGAYPGRVVRLVDGGVHDNQGAGALLEQGCTSIIVSDASGQMSLETAPSGGVAGVALRTNSVLQARVREALYMDLRSRERGKLLRTVGFLHLKRGLRGRVIRAGDPTSAASDDEVTEYGVSRAVQERLAALRTDLDAFSDLEAEMLMTSGYWMAREYLKPSSLHVPDVGPVPIPAVSRGAFEFLRVAPFMTARPSGDAADRRVLELLTIGQSVIGKVWRVNRIAKGAAIALVVFVALALSLVVRHFWASVVVHWTVGAIVITVGLAILEHVAGGASPFVEVVSGGWISRKGRAVALAFGAAIAARVALFADRWFLAAGQVDPLLRRKPAVSDVPAMQPVPGVIAPDR